MPTVIFVRHGRTTANATGVLAGRTPGVELDDTGREQAARTAERLAAVPLAAIVSSPLERCRQTAGALFDARDDVVPLRIDDDLSECDYGDWQGRPLAELATEPLWQTVQRHPASAVFPGGESMVTMQSRAVEAVRRRNREIEAEHGAAAVWVAVSHGDIIKAVLADALGMHLDLFQRLNVNPASVSIVRYGEHRPDVVTVNSDAGDLGWLAAATPVGDAAVGGGSGPEAPSAPAS